MSRQSISRRNFIRLGTATAGALALSQVMPGNRRAAHAQRQEHKQADPRFLFVLTATGGASIIDSFLPVAASEVSDPERAKILTVYPDSHLVQPEGATFRCVRNLSEHFTATPFRNSYEMSDFAAKYRDDMLVMTVENSSVNHIVAQNRSLTGDGIDSGRTILEAVAMAYGQDLPLPNCNMSQDGYIEPGANSDVPDYARGVLINDPTRFAMSTHGSRGIANAPAQSHIDSARAVRAQLEGISPFAQSFAHSQQRQRFLDLRQQLSPQLEGADLITKLLLLENSPNTPLEELGLETSPEFARLAERFPNLATDRLQAQTALAFLLARYGVSCAVAFGPGFIPYIDPGTQSADGTPLAFDFSHNSHVQAQNVNWSRTLEALDGLIALLKAQPHGDGSTSMWDHSLIYVATDFGRSKSRPPGVDMFAFGSGHDLNNGSLLISPRLRGNRIYGGVDPDTCLTHGFDPITGDPDPGRRMGTRHVYSLICQALDIDFPTRENMSGLIR